MDINHKLLSSSNRCFGLNSLLKTQVCMQYMWCPFANKFPSFSLNGCSVCVTIKLWCSHCIKQGVQTKIYIMIRQDIKMWYSNKTSRTLSTRNYRDIMFKCSNINWVDQNCFLCYPTSKKLARLAI